MLVPGEGLAAVRAKNHGFGEIGSFLGFSLGDGKQTLNPAQGKGDANAGNEDANGEKTKS